MPYYYGNFGFGFLGFIFHIIGWIILVFIIIAIIKAFKKGKGSRWMSDSAMELLRERYVKGEITKEEFEQKKKDLNS